MRVPARWSASREPFWTTLDARRRTLPRVLPQRSRRHLRARLSGRSPGSAISINLAELIVLAGVLYVVLLAGADAVQRADVAHRRRAAARCCASPLQLLPQAVPRVRRRRGRAGRRSSRSPSAPTSPTQARAGVEEAAARTATVAQRLVEDYATLQQRGAAALDVDRRSDHGAGPPRDRQDVNLFDRSQPRRRRAQRDLFASRLLLAAHAERRLPRASCSTGCRPSSASKQVGDFAVPGWPPRRSAPAAARASSPCR